MIVTDLGPSLRFGVAQFQKTSGQQSNGNGYRQNNYGGGYQQPNNGYQQGAYNNYQQQGYGQQAPAQTPAQPAAPSQPAMIRGYDHASQHGSERRRRRPGILNGSDIDRAGRSGDDLRLYKGDCRRLIASLPDNSVDAVVTDPPYEIGFMNRGFDRTGIAFDVDLWRGILRVLKPGGHVAAFAASRTYHRLAGAIEDAGFEIRDQIDWVYASGMPHGSDASLLVDRKLGAKRTEIVGHYHAGCGYSNKKGWGNSTSNGGTPVTDAEVKAPATPESKAWSGWYSQLKPAHEHLPRTQTIGRHARAQPVGTWDRSPAHRRMPHTIPQHGG